MSRKARQLITVYHEDTILYQGDLHELPIRESVLIQKSIHFFDDPEPCFIHRSAVALRLIVELEEHLLQGKITASQCPLFTDYVNFDTVTTLKYEII